MTTATYIAKYDNELNYLGYALFDSLFSINITGLYYDDFSDSLVMPINIYDSIDLDPGAGNVPESAWPLKYNFALVRLDSNLAYVSHRMFPHYEHAFVNGVVFKDNGDMVVTGDFLGTMVFDPGGSAAFDRTAQGAEGTPLFSVWIRTLQQVG